MLTLHRSVTVPVEPATVFNYLADFRTVNEWDPGATGAVRTAGDGGPGTRYDCDVHFLGRVTRMTYTTVEYASSFGYRRLSWLLEWLLRPALNRLCDDAQRGLQRALSRPRSEGAS